jgi:membrane-associated phospholipid phosphatase
LCALIDRKTIAKSVIAGQLSRQMAEMKFAVIRSFAVAIILCLFAIFLLDEPVAKLFANSVLHSEQKSIAIGAGVFLAPLGILALIFAVLALKDRNLSWAREATILASVSSLCGFAINDCILKPLFGRANVDIFLYYYSHYGFFPFQGVAGSSFPSGHMEIVTAILAVLWHYFPKLRALYIAIWSSAAAILVVGEWHFVSDIIAGSYLGGTIALIAKRLWNRLMPVATLSRIP